MAFEGGYEKNWLEGGPDEKNEGKGGSDDNIRFKKEKRFDKESKDKIQIEEKQLSSFQ